jgi:hypothetical protein
METGRRPAGGHERDLGFGRQRNPAIIVTGPTGKTNPYLWLTRRKRPAKLAQILNFGPKDPI